jgi:hypothetical protein
MPIRSGSIVTILLLLSGMACSAEKTGRHGASNAPQSAGPAALGSTWADASKMPDLFSGTWWNFASFIEDDAKLNVPFTAKAQKYVDAYQYKRDIPYAEDGCQSPGLPITMRLGGALKFTYAPGLISLYMQSVSNTRFIRMNQKQGKTSPKYYGNSVGHWEGDTLVVETSDFLPEITFQYGVGEGLPPEQTFGPIGSGGGAGGPPPGVPPGGLPGAPPGGAAGVAANLSKGIWGPHGEGMHMVERMRLIDSETMEHKLTIYDDTVWTKPYVMTARNYRRIRTGHDIGQFSGDPEEYVCTVSITNFDAESNTYVDKDPDEVVKFLDRRDR